MSRQYMFEVKEQNTKQMVSYPKKEAEKIAEEIGMSFDSDIEYHWFLQQVLQSILPLGWKI